MKIITLILIFSVLTPIAEANLCGPNHGWLPSIATRYCVGTSIPRYDNCGKYRGQLLGQKDHPLMCGAVTWTNENLNTVKVCKNHKVTQCGTLLNTTRCRDVYSKNEGWTWNPAPNTICAGETFTQTSNCGYTRQKTGTKNCCIDQWLPDPGTVCSGESFTQTNQCRGTRQATGTKCCEAGLFAPAENTVCSGIQFQQTNLCGAVRDATGTGNIETCIENRTDLIANNVGDFPHDDYIARLSSPEIVAAHGEPTSASAKIEHRRLVDTREGSVEYHPVVVTANNLDSNAQIPVFTKKLAGRDDFVDFLKAKAKNSLLNNPKSSDKVHFCLDTDYAVTAVDCADSEPRQTSCGNHTILQTCGCSFDTKGSNFPLCDECLGKNLSRVVNYQVLSTGMVPDLNPASVCTTDTVTWRDNCGTTEERPGTRNCSTTCVEPWAPDPSTVCSGVSFTQTRCEGLASNGNRRGSIGTKNCSGDGDSTPPSCGSNHGQERFVGNPSSVTPFSLSDPNLCNSGDNDQPAFTSSSNVDRIQTWQCKNSITGDTVLCWNRIRCDNLATSPCTLDIN